LLLVNSNRLLFIKLMRYVLYKSKLGFKNNFKIL
jgi:hypothetical protein